MKLNFAALSALPVILAAAVLPTAVQAADAPVAATTYNVGVVTDYRYRGISQSRLKPALQGGADYSNPNGVYVGVWASTIQWVKDAGTAPAVDAGSTPLEIDLYGGYKGELAKDLGYDVGALYYLYAGNKIGNIPGASNANTFELYGALTYGLFTAKYSHSLTNLFGAGGSLGAPDSKGSGYLELGASFDLGNGWSVAPHVGRQAIKRYSAASYTDYSLTLGKDLGNGLTLSAALVGTDADKTKYVTPAGKFTGKDALVLGAKFSF